MIRKPGGPGSAVARRPGDHAAPRLGIPSHKRLSVKYGYGRFHLEWNRRAMHFSYCAARRRAAPGGGALYGKLFSSGDGITYYVFSWNSCPRAANAPRRAAPSGLVPLTRRTKLDGQGRAVGSRMALEEKGNHNLEYLSVPSGHRGGHQSGAGLCALGLPLDRAWPAWQHGTFKAKRTRM